MKRLITLFSLLGAMSAANAQDASAQSAGAQRKAPAYPLLVHDPYFSIWSFSDALTDVPTTHWTGKPQPLTGLIKVDDQIYRFMGAATPGNATPANATPAAATPAAAGDQPATQTSVTLTATQTQYSFTCGAIALTVDFTSPLLIKNL